MSHNENLPFERGTTWGGGLATCGDAVEVGLAGRIFEVQDTVHGTDKIVKLRCVKLDTSTALTTARKFYSFSASSTGDFGTKVDGVCGSAGEVGKPMDDAYAVGSTIPAWDYFYVVEEGPCYVNTESSSVSLAYGAAVATDATGFVNGAVASANECILGRMAEASTKTSTAVTIEVIAGLSPGVGGGS